jgi:two-component system cell cycle sensor histidine kinase/response regulator CckA
VSEGPHIAFVDDDDTLGYLMAWQLRRRGLQVSCFTDPAQAIAAIARSPSQYSLVLTDYRMPAMDGIEVSIAVRGIRADLPVAVLTGYITDELRDKAARAGVTEVISKTRVDRLAEAIEHLALAPRAAPSPQR